MELSAEKRAELINYIADARRLNKKDPEIVQLLLAAGWLEDDIKPVLASLAPRSKISPTVLILILLSILSFGITGTLLFIAFRNS